MAPLRNGSPSPWRYAGVDPATQTGRWIGEDGEMAPAELGKHGTSVNTYTPTQVGKDGKIDPDTGQDAEQAARFAVQENRRGLGGVLGALPGCLYVSHPQAIARAEYKPAQLAAAIREGLTVPATLITNDPMGAEEFCAERPTIYKPLHAGAYDVEGEPAGIWAAPAEPGETDGAVSHSAHLFQAQVPKVADVRVVVVGEQVFSARITAPPGVVDWRADYQHLTYEPVACPDGIRGALVLFLARFGLSFGAFDFAVTADGAWWFLEVNPNGQWAWLEEAAGLPITHAIADLLENGAGEDD